MRGMQLNGRENKVELTDLHIGLPKSQIEVTKENWKDKDEREQQRKSTTR